eukprot:s1526_g4.t1
MAIKSAGEDIAFRPPVTPFTLLHYAAPDGGRRTTYEREVSTCEAVGDQAKSRAYLKMDRLPREFLAQEAIATGSAKVRASQPDAPVHMDPKIKRLMREIAISEGHRQEVVMDPAFVNDIRRKHKIDHFTSILTDPRLPTDDCSTYSLQHQYEGHLADRVDKKHFLQKNTYSEYVEALGKQKGLMMDKNKGTLAEFSRPQYESPLLPCLLFRRRFALQSGCPDPFPLQTSGLLRVSPKGDDPMVWTWWPRRSLQVAVVTPVLLAQLQSVQRIPECQGTMLSCLQE